MAAITRSSRRVIASTTSVPGSARWPARGRVRRGGCGSSGGWSPPPPDGPRSPWVLTGCTASVWSTAPAAVSSPQRNCLVSPLRAAAARWVAAAGRDGRSMKAVKALPVAYPGPEPSRSPAAALTRRTVPSLPSRNNGTGACWKTACSSLRSACAAAEEPWPPLPRLIRAAVRGQRGDRGVQFGERGLQQGRRVGPGQRGGLPERAVPGLEAGDLTASAVTARRLLHWPQISASLDSGPGTSLTGWQAGKCGQMPLATLLNALVRFVPRSPGPGSGDAPIRTGWPQPPLRSRRGPRRPRHPRSRRAAAGRPAR